MHAQTTITFKAHIGLQVHNSFRQQTEIILANVRGRLKCWRTGMQVQLVLTAAILMEKGITMWIHTALVC
jgi:hypothetical protein